MENLQSDIGSYELPKIPPLQAPEATCSVRLSAKDEAEVIAAAEKPPVPNEAALQAARRFIQRHG